MQYNHFITGRIIRELREQQGLTQEVLSGLAVISRSHLAELENGHTNANVETLWKISEALGMKMSDLIRMVEQTIERECLTRAPESCDAEFSNGSGKRS